MLEKLFEKYNQISRMQNYSYRRYFYHTIDFKDKMIGILGSRGVGKTTVMLQHLESSEFPKSKKLYFSADSIITSATSLYNIADEFCKSDGKLLAIVEIHKYKDYRRE